MSVILDAKGLNKVRGQPFTIGEIVRGAKAALAGEQPELEDSAADDDAGNGG